DLWAWQFLWIVGIYLGVRWGRGDLNIDAWAKRLMIPSIIVASALFELRRALNNGQDLGPFEAIFDKWHLGPVLLLNFAAVAVLLILLQPVLKPLAFRPLVLVRQTPLKLFCVHLLLIWAGIPGMGKASMLRSTKEAGLLTVTSTAMLTATKL